MIEKLFGSKIFNEKIEVDEFGIKFDGDLINVFIGKSPSNDFSILKINGEKTLAFKSFAELSYEYNDASQDKLKKIYLDIMKKYAKEIEKISKKFEDDLSKIIKNIEKNLKEL